MPETPLPSSQVATAPSSPERPQRAASPVWRGLRLRCPACGEGRVLAGYLKPADACAACGEDFSDIRADDGPAWATILVVGHLVSPAFFVFASAEGASLAALAFIVALVLGLTFAILPRAKGLFIALIWASRRAERPQPARLEPAPRPEA